MEKNEIKDEIKFEISQTETSSNVCSNHYSLKRITRVMAVLIDGVEKEGNIDTLYFFLPFIHFLYDFVEYTGTQKEDIILGFSKVDIDWIIGAMSAWQTLCNKIVAKKGDEAPEFCKKEWANAHKFSALRGLYVGY